MSRFCLDTSAYSHFKRGDAAAVEAISRARWLGVPVVVLGELRTGFLLGARPERKEADLARFLANPVVEVLAVDEEAAQIYAEIVVAQRRAGKPAPTNDLWIAALAARAGAPVLTFDAHFEAISRISARVLG
ncbi:MAG TPA: type II toxin-antitoxin system VapC family toxin [Polyangia bacterium]|nr:type II toxin-antitoxin system VapC family toxin [Polyangia bacterium]